MFDFTNEFFPGLFESITDVDEQIAFVEYLKLMVFSHRHNKDDAYLKETIASFDIVRDPNYKYSKQAEHAFLSEPVYAFLLACFSCTMKG